MDTVPVSYHIPNKETKPESGDEGFGRAFTQKTTNSLIGIVLVGTDIIRNETERVHAKGRRNIGH